MSQCCRAKWGYSLSVDAYTGCETCGPEVSYSVGQECSQCHKSFGYKTDLRTWELPQLITSPELDKFWEDKYGQKSNS